MYQPYPSSVNENNVVDFCRNIARIRKDDVEDFTNLPNIYMRGRKVGKIPTASNDVSADDRLGDFSFALDASYMYVLVDNAGTTQWRRITMGSF